ncbi:hypothetical protein Sa4125_44310 [Aureimonas sp. SA4125]|uniref:BrnA antitoxin family protein n=1 Tax=Aureimonas sp. SA4125 TaxID=2826993 RepID=UPI001CC54421|nr:BrnA antitoxin family protein [Aureimonas sp. SA4125]BDA86889.1 hypothetical protein Sa4125_44310 [Aureimonas sp. SA4125]
MAKQEKFVEGRGYSREDWDAVSDNPEWTEADLANAQPMAEAMPELYAKLVAAQAARDLKAAGPPVPVDLDGDLVERLKATGPGWESRANDALRHWLDQVA